MTIDKLSHDQKLALVALIELVTLSDGTISEGEEKQIGLISQKLGEESYRALLDETDSRFSSEADLKAFLETIVDRESREAIYGLVMEEVINSPSVVPQRDLLEWLESHWNVCSREITNDD